MNDETKELATSNQPAPLFTPKHHPKSMSKWAPIMECPCFESSGETADSVLGTKCHKLLADTLDDYIHEGTTPAPEVIATAGLHEAGALKAGKAIIEKWWGDHPHVESQVEIPGTGIYGTPDFYALTKRGCVVVDFKTFYNPGRDYFPQLCGYALAIIKSNYPEAEWESKQADMVVIYGDKPDATESCRDTFANLEATFERVMDNFCERETGYPRPHQCNWCDLCASRATCPEVMKVAKTVAEGELLHAPEKWQELTIARRAQMLVLAEAVSKWADTVRGLAKEDALNGVAIQDLDNGIAFKLRESRGRMAPRIDDLWRNCQRLGISADDFRLALTCTSTNATKLIYEKGQGVKTKKDAEEIVRACSDVGKGSVSLVRA